MDKLENESWADCAFKHEAFYIVYADKEEQIIDDVRFADPDKYYYPYTSEYRHSYGTDIIWRKIEEIAKKYRLDGRQYDRNGFSFSAQKNMKSEDIERHKKLYSLYQFWQIKEKDYELKKYKRYMELIKIISETHKEEFEELSKIARISPPYLSLDMIEYKETAKVSNERYTEKLTREKHERVEIYKKYLKNNEIRSQINELEQKINKLKDKFV
jgi:hypothetical protein